MSIWKIKIGMTKESDGLILLADKSKDDGCMKHYKEIIYSGDPTFICILTNDSVIRHNNTMVLTIAGQPHDSERNWYGCNFCK